MSQPYGEGFSTHNLTFAAPVTSPEHANLSHKRIDVIDYFPRFGELPPELRFKVYAYLLPSTINDPSTGTPAWCRGQTSLLRLCRSVHDECAAIMYGRNTFMIELTYDRIDFLFRWMLPSFLVPKRTFAFPSHFPPKYLRLMRNFVIHVEQLDSYMGMIKYNCGGDGLLVGVRDQIARLVNALSLADRLGSIYVQLGEGGRLQNIRKILDELRTAQSTRTNRYKRDMSETQVVLEPFRNLHAIGRADVSGAVTRAYGQSLAQSMMSTVGA